MAMNGGFDFAGAVKAGHSPEDIAAFLKQNPQLVPYNTPQNLPTQQQMPQTQADTGYPTSLNLGGTDIFQQKQNDPILSLVKAGLPVAGAVGGELLGGPVGAIAGASAGQAGSDLLGGKKPGWDVPLTGALTGAGGLLGKVVGGVGSKLLGGLGEDLSTGGLNLTRSMVNKVEAQNGESIINTLAKNKLSGANANSLEDALGGLYKQQNEIAKNVPFNFDTFATHADDALGKLKNSPVESVRKLYEPVNQNVQNVLEQASKKDFSLDKVLSQFDRATKDAQFGTGEWGANRYTGNILRKTLYDTADGLGMAGPEGQTVKELGLNLRNMQNIADAAAKREGVGRGGFPGLPDLLGGDIMSRVAEGAGINPALGFLLPGVKAGYAAIRSNPMLAGIISKGLTSGGEAIAGATPALSLAGEAGGSKLSAMLGGAPQSIDGNTNNKNEGQHSNLSFLDQSISQSGQDVNSQGGIKTFSGNGSFPDSLPEPSQISNTIPNQPYPQEQYMQDLQTIQDEATKYGSNPRILAQLEAQKQTIDAKKSANDSYLSTYLDQNGLDQNAKDFVRNANPEWNKLTQLHALLEDKGAQDTFHALLQMSPEVQKAMALRDPKYALMVNLLNQARFAQAKASQGGRVTSYDLALTNAFSPGQTKAGNLTNLDYAMKQFLDQYSQYAPLYGLTQQQQPAKSAPGGGGSLTGHPMLDNALGF